MPEGPSIVILKELVQQLNLEGQAITAVDGNTKIDKERLIGKTVTAFASWGKHFLICFDDFTLRIHFLLFGSYRINERKQSMPRLRLQFTADELNFYACSVQFLEAHANQIYDWSADLMSDSWSHEAAIQKLRGKPNQYCCDALLDQDIFAGSGNIFKNEVLFRIRVHPLSVTGQLPNEKLHELARETRAYAFDFFKWKKAFVLKKHWLAHTKKICPRCNIPFQKAHLGQTKRRTFYCENCQVLYQAD